VKYLVLMIGSSAVQRTSTSSEAHTTGYRQCARHHRGSSPAPRRVDTLVGRRAGAPPRNASRRAGRVAAEPGDRAAVRRGSLDWSPATRRGAPGAVRTELGLPPGAPVPLTGRRRVPPTAFRRPPDSQSPRSDRVVREPRTTRCSTRRPSTGSRHHRRPSSWSHHGRRAAVVDVGEERRQLADDRAARCTDFDLPQAYLRVEEEIPRWAISLSSCGPSAGGVAWRVCVDPRRVMSDRKLAGRLAASDDHGMRVERMGAGRRLPRGSLDARTPQER